MQAIETRYKGYRFRSRLEARWAVFFDTLGIKYQYEPEGFMLPDGTRYLPDFYLPESGTWVEVKGVMSENDAHKMRKILAKDSPLPWFNDSANSIDHMHEFEEATGNNGSQFFPGLLILGDIPHVENGGIVFNRIIRQYGTSLISSYSMFGEDGRQLVIEHSAYPWPWVFTGVDFTPKCIPGHFPTHDNIKHFAPNSLFVEAKMSAPKAIAAYKAARSARFEHGESGAAT